jgi:hypothetical protein
MPVYVLIGSADARTSCGRLSEFAFASKVRQCYWQLHAEKCGSGAAACTTWWVRQHSRCTSTVVGGIGSLKSMMLG